MAPFLQTELVRQLTTQLAEVTAVEILGARAARLSWQVISAGSGDWPDNTSGIQVTHQANHIRGYHIHIKEVASDPPVSPPPALSTVTTSGGAATSHTLTNLKPSTAYHVFMVPYSSSGLARPSNLKTFSTKEDVPESSPTDVELKLLNSTTAVVYWRKPSQADINGKLTGFKIEIFSNSSLVTNFTLEPTATSLLLSNLTKSVIYTVRLAAFNRAGMGPFSGPVSLKVEPSLLYQPQLPHPSLAFPPEAPLQPIGELVSQTW